ncbi:Delta-1-pyrroline-5-carboxylate dehydrogenase 12a1 protein [Thalictrum thalictroides]|uniref:Delta-1-pyrroline-5-carboxylate dehydrogenase 12a1 protein n=1 Tax=Thalictrum thalictroides TaxID=46969 RepID=A0A7J6VAZ6_THATH|nr:Delta-1-pyrroline-5-carboxylate dehydrogenase 12a1 protein [Thalictrum thalictroides]
MCTDLVSGKSAGDIERSFSIIFIDSSYDIHSEISLILMCFRSLQTLSFATVEAKAISGSQPAEVQKLVQGTWKGSSNLNTIVDPLNGEPFIKVGEVDETGVQDPQLKLYSSHQYLNSHASAAISRPAWTFGQEKEIRNGFYPILDGFLQKVISRPLLSHAKFLENFCGDQVRLIAR